MAVEVEQSMLSEKLLNNVDAQLNGIAHVNTLPSAKDFAYQPKENGINGINGANGVNGVNGVDHANGVNGANGVDHTNGAHGANGYTLRNGEVFTAGHSLTNGPSLTNGDAQTTKTNGEHLASGELRVEVHTLIDGETSTGRAEETADLLRTVEELLIPFIGYADAKVRDGTHNDHKVALKRDALVRPYEPHEVIERMKLALPEKALGKDGLTSTLERLLKYSVNTWHQGFMHKLYATTNPIGVASELILSVLNTALHVYKVSPALSVIERTTAQKLARLFGLPGSHAGGGTHPGGTASNLAALVTARNTLFPDIRKVGNGTRRLALFTSADSHYSISKAAQTCGIGSDSVFSIPPDAEGRMRMDALEAAIKESRDRGMSPFFINATAGTTVLGACDPLHEVSAICRREGLWMHVDASWGGGAVFSDTYRHKMSGAELADSITFNPHKQLGVPITCSFLLGADMRVFWRANRIDAGYLFHDDAAKDEQGGHADDDGNVVNGDDGGEVSWDLADSTLQCGRRGDSLKLALAWIYSGREGLGRYIDAAYAGAEYLARLVRAHPDLILHSQYPPPCLQVCFYHQPDGTGRLDGAAEADVTRHTNDVCEALVARGLMIDHAPGPRGNFIRAVINGRTTRDTIECLVDYIVAMK